MIAGFDLPDTGQILLDGQDLADTPAAQRPVRATAVPHPEKPFATLPFR